jgi:hypothetical protein
MRLFANGPERLLWQEVGGSQLGVPFRRQVVLGNRYIADLSAASGGSGLFHAVAHFY